MTQKDEWGPWIEHDGKGCPVRGQFVHVVFFGGWPDSFLLAGSEGTGRARSWDRNYLGLFPQVKRYRVRKPRGLTILEDIARTVDHKSPADTPCMDAFEGAR